MGQWLTVAGDHCEPPTTPACTCSCTEPRCQYRIGSARDHVTRRLRDASLSDLIDGRNRFVPRGRLVEIINQDEVLNHLRTVFGRQNSDHVAVVKYVCPEKACACGRERCSGGRVIFATLAMIGLEREIYKFSRSGRAAWVCDSNLGVLLGSVLAARRKRRPPLFRGNAWGGSVTREVFCQLIWLVMPPFFNKFDPAKKEDRQIIDDRASLPWTGIDKETKPEAGEFGYVVKFQIHGDQHDLGQRDDHFALKIFSGSRNNSDADIVAEVEKEFSDEIYANGHLRPHERIVPLLHAFKHRHIFHLVFPWADGGNLRDLWGRVQARLDDATLDWFWAQCLGLADALAAVHDWRVLHNDIKPENVLCFTREGGGGETDPDEPAAWELRVADFGISQRVGAPDSMVEPTSRHVVTQRSPEFDLKYESVSFPVDIWSLGCVYLDFITWLLLGNEERLRFERRRVAELGDPDGPGPPIEEDTYFKIINVPQPGIGEKTVKKVALVKDSVLEHFKLLKGNPSGPDEIVAFLDFLEKSILVIEPRGRETSKGLQRFLQNCQASRKKTKGKKKTKASKRMDGPGPARRGSGSLVESRDTGSHFWYIAPLSFAAVAGTLAIMLAILRDYFSSITP